MVELNRLIMLWRSVIWQYNMFLLDLICTRLTSISRNGDGTIQAACPACRAEGQDKQGVHLRVWPSGAFSCAAHQDDRAHNKLIRSLIRGDDDSTDSPLYQDTEYIDPDPRPDIVKVYDEGMLNKLIPDYSYWIGRGIDEKVLKKLGGGVANSEEKSKLSGRYILPCRDEKERIIGWTGRLLVDFSFAPKYKIIGRKSSFLFPPISIVEPAVRASGDLILVESQGDAMALLSAGIDCVYSLFGVTLSSKLVGRIVALNPKRIIIATNNEENQGKGHSVGNKAAIAIKDRLSSFVPEERILIHLPPTKDLAELTGDQIKEWYSGVPSPSAAPVAGEDGMI